MTTAFSPKHFRQYFPALSEEHCYLDSAATALKPAILSQATCDYYNIDCTTVHRSQHQHAVQLTHQFEESRALVAQLLNAASSDEIIWTHSATESLNLVAQSYFKQILKPGDEILVCESEHHANLLPWLLLAEQTGAKVIKLPIASNYLPDLAALPNTLSERCKVFAISQMSNVTGGSPDLKQAIQLAHLNNTLVVVDGAQGIVHHLTDVQELDIDFYAFSAHKLYGPTGVGVLYAKAELLAQMQPWLVGGHMVDHVSFSTFTPAAIPSRFEAGTANIAGILGFAAVLRWLMQIDRPVAEHYSRQLTIHAYNQLAIMPGFISYRAGNSSILSFNFADCHPIDIATLLAEQNIAVRAGQLCAQPLMAAFGVSGVVRASFAPYNTFDEADAFVKALHNAINLLTE